MTTVQLLKAARERIADPERWWDGRDNAPDGTVCAWLAFDEVAKRCSFSPLNCEAEWALARVMGVPEPRKIPEFNDTHTHTEVLAAFDEAIANELAREAEFTVPDMVHA